MKKYLDTLKKEYETKDFIKDDPIQFPHKFKDRANIELMGFLASIFAFGKRELFIKKLNDFLTLSNNNPFEFILNFEKNQERLSGFIYRFYKDFDIIALCFILRDILKFYNTLGNFFFECSKNKNVLSLLQNVYDYFSSSKYNPHSKGFSFMMSNPYGACANKRMNMFLRWMIRGGVVDFGIWDFLEPKDLIIPLDIHVGNVSRGLGLLKRKQNNCLAALELTDKLREFNPLDPVGYDFALFGLGVKVQTHVRQRENFLKR